MNQNINNQQNSNEVSEDFLVWLDTVIKFSKESIFVGGECDDMQIRLMEQIRHKYVRLNGGLNTINEPIKDEELDKKLHDEIYELIADNIGNIVITPTVKRCIEAAKKYAASKLNNTIEDKWISVEDRLPEEGGRYWCYTEQQTDLGLSHFQWNCSYNETTKTFSDRYLIDGERVTHWQPLPSSPLPPKPTK